MESALFEAPAKLPATPARFNGWCHLCEHRILGGVEIIVPLDGGWVHADCAEEHGHEVTSYE